MFFLVVHPRFIDDPEVFHLAVKRSKILSKNVILIEGNPNTEELERLRVTKQDTFAEGETVIFSHTPVEVNTLSGPELGRYQIDAFGKTQSREDDAEEDYLDGTYANMRTFHDAILPHWQEKLERIALKARKTHEDVCIQVDLGKSLTTLYLAYFASRLTRFQGITLSLMFHAPAPGDRFSIGGQSRFAQFRPLLRRHVALDAIRKTSQIFIDNKDLAPVLQSLFPGAIRDILLDPLAPVTPESESARDAVLSSSAARG